MNNQAQINNEELQTAYDNGRIDERNKLVEEFQKRESRSASRGILLGILLTAVVGGALTLYKIAKGFPTEGLGIPVTLEQPEISDHDQNNRS
ncbi:hypothetical protein Pse7367_1780 [Thalassoporum mexicanum PCC 7367]|uniref:hypothetical protein n=1 Tax=Thalassoporum mexicanum TaxID=3457544 RepID=UPI00029FE3DC|nr:hypothetical protein [Pseudanabaena sp. PCC 7367]AFY70058.1 hypothetical protein Pse7367_1780 [Pseudanabaena sp. PCC 7367]